MYNEWEVFLCYIFIYVTAYEFTCLGAELTVHVLCVLSATELQLHVNSAWNILVQSQDWVYYEWQKFHCMHGSFCNNRITMV